MRLCPALTSCSVQVPAWWEGAGAGEKRGEEAYPMDYYAKEGGVWNSSYHKAPARAKTTAPVVLQALS